VQAGSTTTIEFLFNEKLVQDDSVSLVPVNLSGASTIRVRFKKPDETTFDRTLDDTLLYMTDGTDGIVRYKFTTDESVEGVWQCQGYVEWEGVSEFHSDVRTFTFKPNIAISV
jgi:hypothetical protein